MFLNGISELYDEIQQKFPLGGEFFHSFYKDLIANFAEFCQLLPNAAQQVSISMLHQSFERIRVFYRDFLATRRQIDNRVAFALFSYILFKNIGLVANSYYISVYDEQKKFLADFNPLVDQWSDFYGYYYRVRYSKDHKITLRNRLNPLFAVRIMPDLGLRWLQQDPYLFNDWLALLAGDEAEASQLHAHLSQINEIANDQSMPEQPVELEEGMMMQQDQQAIDELFWQWLKNQVDSQQIAINQTNGMIHVTQEGVLLDHPRLFEEFAKTVAGVDPITVYQQLNYSGLVQLSGGDVRIAKFFTHSHASAGSRLRHRFAGSDQDTVVKGVMLKHADTLFANGRKLEINRNLRPMASHHVVNDVSKMPTNENQNS